MEVDQIFASTSKLDIVNSLLNCQTRTPNRTLGLLITQMVTILWKWTFVVPLFHHDSAKVLSLSMAPIQCHQIITLNTWNPNRCVFPEPKNTQTKRKKSSGIYLTVFIFRGGSVLCSCSQPNPRTSDHSDGQHPMEMDFCGPSLPP